MIVNLFASLILLITLPGNIYLFLVTCASVIFALSIKPRKTNKIHGSIRFAVIIPAHNESKNLLIAVDSLRSCDPPNGSYDLIVIADNCADDTADVARQAGCRVIEREHDTLRGKGYALEFGFEKLMGEDYDAFIVIDADTRCDQNLIVEFERKMAEGMDVLQAPYFVDDSKGGFYAQIVNIGFRAFNFLRPSARDLLGLSVGIFGTGFALSTKVVKEIPYTASSIVEDVEYHICLVRAGYISRFVSETCVYSAMPEGNESARTQRSRWEGGRLRLILDKSWPLTKEIVRGKWRLVDPLMELLLLPLWLHVTLVLSALLIPSLYFKLYGLLSIAIVIFHVVAAILSTGGGARELNVLFLVPKYILWKILISQNILKKSAKTAKWDRTPRD